jgi:ribonuclease R
MIDFKDKLFDFLKKSPQAWKPRDLAKKLSIKDKAYPQFREYVQRLAREGQLAKTGGGKYQLPRTETKPARELVGTLKMYREEFGFVRVPGQSLDIYVRSQNLGPAIDGDTVALHLTGQRRQGRNPEGRVTRVMEQGIQTVVGTFGRNATRAWVVPDGKRVLPDLDIRPGAENKAQPGDRVTARIVERTPRLLVGEVMDILGAPGTAAHDFLAVAHECRLPLEFPAGVEVAARKCQAENTPAEMATRLDVRDRTIVTIDPDDAKDFDDAVSLERLDNGLVRLGVHIADVSWYVRAGTPLDKEALARGNSVYLADRVIPMLPEALSADLCSLRPHEDRRTLSVCMDIDEKGMVQRYDIKRSLIRSAARLTYGQAQEIIDGKQDPPRAEVKALLLDLRALKNILYQRRIKEGSLDLELPEAKIELDATGRPIKIGIEVRLDSHRLIEECMLAANRTVARSLADSGLPQVYRVHEPPSEDDMEQFWYLMDLAGLAKNKAKRSTVQSLQSFLRKVPPDRTRMVHELLLRSLRRAQYSVQNRGHYGLGFTHYAHFTSPIRRYADLLIHRIVTARLDGQEGIHRTPEARRQLEFAATHVTQQEEKADQAERLSTKLKQLAYMESRLGSEYPGYVSGVQGYGLFITLDEIMVEGLARVADMPDDYYIYDEKSMLLKGRRTKEMFRLGDRVRVQVVKVNRERREIDLRLL